MLIVSKSQITQKTKFFTLKHVTVNDESLVGLKFGEFGESRVIRQTKIIQTFRYVIIIINSQHHSPNFPLLNLLRTEFAKLSS